MVLKTFARPQNKKKSTTKTVDSIVSDPTLQFGKSSSFTSITSKLAICDATKGANTTSVQFMGSVSSAKLTESFLA